MEYLFVYGTLTQSSAHPMAEFLRGNCQFVEKAYVHGRLYLVTDYPGLVLSKNSQQRVIGNIYGTSKMDNVLKVLDDYEEVGPGFPYPQEYKREHISAYNKKAQQAFQCWAYIYNFPTDNLKLIQSGDFGDFMENH